MPGLVACPFCREMFEPGEHKACPECGLALKRLEDLPKATTAVTDDEPERAPSPDEEKLPWSYLGRGRGILLAASAAGIGAFFLPWVHERAPEIRTLTGAGLAAHLGWIWAPLVAWLVMIPLVLSRRSIYRMRGARVAVAFLAAMSLLTVLVRYLAPRVENPIDPHRYEWGVGLYATGLCALVALFAALSFGGRIDDLPTKKLRREGDETLH